jgi:glycosyltransferase involved in cell wall biosynthesis
MEGVAISAVIPTYNRRGHIARAIASIVSDAPVPMEILVVDDGSTDGTADLIREKFGRRVNVIRQPNAGVSAARRRGVLAAKGEWIAFLDSDDEWVRGRSQILANAAAGAPANVDWIFGDTRIVDAKGEGTTLFGEYNFKVDTDIDVIDEPLRTQYPLQISLLQSSLIRRKAIIAAGAFDDELRSSEDFLLGFRIALQSRFAAVPQVVTRLYRTPDLKESSLDRHGQLSPDFHRARMIAFREAAETIGRKHWGGLYEASARRFVLASYENGHFYPHVSKEQFRFGGSFRSIAFQAAVSLGPLGLRLWRQLFPAGGQSLAQRIGR